MTLHDVTEKTKLIAKWAGIAIGTIIILVILFRIGVNIKNYFYPPKPIPPTVTFGKLPAIKFPISKRIENFSYTIDTVSGTLPVFSDRATVNKIIQSEPDILALKRAESRVSQVGFPSSTETQISDRVYRWTDNQSLNKIMSANIFSFNFNLTSNFLSNPKITGSVNILNEQDAISAAQSFLSSLSSFPNDIDISKTKTTLFTIKDGQLVTATSLSNTQIIRVDFFQKDYNNLKIYYSDYPFSIINILASGGGSDYQIVEANYFHHDISDKSATYPIKTSDEAFSNLQKGNAYIVSYNGTGLNIKIKNVYLGYYLGETEQDYLMPIVVFEGNDNFFAFVSAVKNEWVDE